MLLTASSITPVCNSDVSELEQFVNPADAVNNRTAEKMKFFLIPYYIYANLVFSSYIVSRKRKRLHEKATIYALLTKNADFTYPNRKLSYTMHGLCEHL